MSINFGINLATFIVIYIAKGCKKVVNKLHVFLTVLVGGCALMLFFFAAAMFGYHWTPTNDQVLSVIKIGGIAIVAIAVIAAASTK